MGKRNDQLKAAVGGALVLLPIGARALDACDCRPATPHPVHGNESSLSVQSVVAGPAREARPDAPPPPPPRQSIPYSLWDQDEETNRIVQQNLLNSRNQTAAIMFKRSV